MAEQVLLSPSISKEDEALNLLEQARKVHEKYLIKQQDCYLEQAISMYVDVVKLDPSLSESYYRLASLMWQKGQISLAGAIEQCKTAITLEPSNVNAHIYTGYFLGIAHCYDEAEAELRQAISKSKINSARPRLFLSKMLLQKMSEEKIAIKDIAKFLYYFITGGALVLWDYPSVKMFCKLLIDDFSVFSYSALGGTLGKIRMFQPAFTTYAKGVKKTGHADIFYKKLGDLALECQDHITAIEFYKRVLNSTQPTREILLKLAQLVSLNMPEEIDEIIEYYNRALEFEVENDKLYYELGHLYLKKNDKINAISAFKLALDMCPGNPYYNNSLGYAFVKAELYDDAIEYYQKAIKINPDAKWTSIICHALGAIYGEIKGNFDAAEATFQAGLVLDSDNYDLVLSLGDLYMARGDLDRAIRTYCDAITLDSQQYMGYAKAGLALWEKDYVEEAIVALHKSINLNPEFESTQNNLGVIYLDGIGNPTEALKYFLNAIEIAPAYALAYFNAGRCYQLMNEKTKAAHYYQMALDLNKDTHELMEDDINDRIHSLFE